LDAAYCTTRVNVPLWLRLPAVAVTVTMVVPAGVVVPLPLPLPLPLLPPQPEMNRPSAAKTTRAEKRLFHLRRDRKMPPRPNRMKASTASRPILA